MDKKLTAIRNRAAEVLGNIPKQREEIMQAISKAKSEKEDAEAIRDKTIVESEFMKAEKDIAEAEHRIAFNQRLLDHMNRTQRMSDSEYNEALDDCNIVALSARDAARAKIRKAMGEIRAALEDYQQAIDETNETLRQLDGAANILQARDPITWQSSATRFVGAELFEDDANADPSMRYAVHNSVYCAAWRANADAWPERVF